MPLRLELTPSPTGPGYAQLTVAGWQQDAGSIELSVQRNQDGRFLDEDGGWTTNPVWHDVSVLERNGEVLSGEMGPWLVDPLVQNPTVAYMFELRSAEHKDKGVLRIKGQILSSQAAGNSVHQEVRSRPANVAPVREEPQAPPAPEPEPQPAPQAVQDPVPDPPAAGNANPAYKPEDTSRSAGFPPHRPIEEEPATVVTRPAAPEQKRSKLPLYLVLAVLALLLIGGAAALYLGLSGKTQPETAAGSPCSKDAMESAEDLAFVQSCLKSNPSTEEVLAVIKSAKDSKRCNIAQRLYAYKAQGGDARIALAYAREYDPDTFKGGCIDSADKETALYWYEIVLNKDPDNAEVKQRVEQLSQ